MSQPPDLLITVCGHAEETCPAFPGSVCRLHWPFNDPAAIAGSGEIRLAAFRKVRDQIRERIAKSFHEL